MKLSAGWCPARRPSRLRFRQRHGVTPAADRSRRVFSLVAAAVAPLLPWHVKPAAAYTKDVRPTEARILTIKTEAVRALSVTIERLLSTGEGMNNSLREVKLDDILGIIGRNYSPGTQPAEDTDVESLAIALNDYFLRDRETTRAVLGVDIYRYSHYQAQLQRLIPIIFRILYDSCVSDMLERESLLFRGSAEELRRNFISTGDGGFQVLPSPLHAIAFALYFEAHLHWFNSLKDGNVALRELVGPITLRWAITYDSLFRFDANFFGSAIISNARMLSRDRLNRCLAAENAMDWFRRRCGNLESIIGMDVANIHDVLSIPRQDSGRSVLFQWPQPLRFIMVQKIGSTEAKGTALDVHSVFIQARIRHPSAESDGDLRNVVVALGNANSAGLAT